ncbi:MAG: MarR family transcriptional regulator, partial [Flavobacteriales bacterium]
MKPEDTIDFNIRSTWHKISRMYNIQAAEHGVSMATGMVLLNIDLKEGTPSTSLGPKMGMESRSLTRTLKNLEEEKIIYRQPDKKDKRMVRIFLTELGIEKRNLSREKVIQFNT